MERKTFQEIGHIKKDETVWIYGKHAVEEALESKPEIIREIFLSREQNEQDARSIKDKAMLAKINISFFAPNKLPKGVDEDIVHQGAMARVSVGKLVRQYGDFIKTLDIKPSTSVIILGEIEDPHNVGAVIRSAAAFGVSAVLIPRYNQAPVNGTVIKVSAGMAFHIPLVEIGNVNETARDLKSRGFWVYGLDAGAKQKVGEEKFDRPSAFILGNEATGLRQKTREVCDILLSIPMKKTCESINASVGAAIALYEWSKQHPPRF